MPLTDLTESPFRELAQSAWDNAIMSYPAPHIFPLQSKMKQWTSPKHHVRHDKLEMFSVDRRAQHFRY